MFKLTADELDEAKAALLNHGIGGFLPPMPEWDLVLANWDSFRTAIGGLDLDTYAPLDPLSTYAPKKRAQLRPISLLHSQDTIIYTALVLILRDAIELQRLPAYLKKSFSYRAPSERGVLYKNRGTFESYRKRTTERIALKKTEYVSTVDISDFFPRIYQHRLENALEAASRNDRERAAVRVLLKLLNKISGGRSYGIPTGPFASRNLAEAVLIDVDSTLQAKGVDFVRWVDDITIFTKSEEEAQEIIYFVAAWLHDKHGLSLNPSKTYIYQKTEFLNDVWKSYDEERKEFRELVKDLNEWADYDDDEDDDDGGEDHLDAKDLDRIFDLSLTIENEPKYGLVRFLLERGVTQAALSRDDKRLVLLQAMGKAAALSPVFDAIVNAIVETGSITKEESTKFAKGIFRSLSDRKTFQPGQMVSWLCWFTGEAGLKSLAPQLREIAESTTDECVRREALIALSKVGSRADILNIKDRYRTLPQTVRPALVYASRLLGSDERKFWKREIPITDAYDKLIFDTPA